MKHYYEIGDRVTTTFLGGKMCGTIVSEKEIIGGIAYKVFFKDDNKHYTFRPRNLTLLPCIFKEAT